MTLSTCLTDALTIISFNLFLLAVAAVVLRLWLSYIHTHTSKPAPTSMTLSTYQEYLDDDECYHDDDDEVSDEVKTDLASMQRNKQKTNAEKAAEDKAIIAAALIKEDDELFQMPPRNEDCSICLVELPEGAVQYQACCGSTICGGCMHSVNVEANKTSPWAKVKGPSLCPFCRKPTASSGEETVRRLRIRMSRSDPTAISILGSFYAQGHGVEKRNVPKAIELWKQAAKLGSIDAYAYLGDAYNLQFDNRRGVRQGERDWKISAQYYESAAKGGHVQARLNLAALYQDNRNPDRDLHISRRQFLIAAKQGHDGGLVVVKQGYVKGEYTKDEFANALRAHKDSQDVVKS